MNITKKLMIAAGLFFQLSSLHTMNEALALFQGVQPMSLSRVQTMRLVKEAGNTPEAQAFGLYAIQGGANITNRGIFRNAANIDVAAVLAARAQAADNAAAFNHLAGSDGDMANFNSSLPRGAAAAFNHLPGNAAGYQASNTKLSNRPVRDLRNPAMAAELQQAIEANPELAQINEMPAGSDKRLAARTAAAHKLADAINMLPASEQNNARQAASNIILGNQPSSAVAYSNSNKNLGRLSNNSPKSSPKSSAKSAKMAQGAQAQKTANTAS